jgi:hypothetical protein
VRHTQDRGFASTLTSWDLFVFSRAAGAAAATLLLAWLVTAATDEGGVAWGERLGRTLPLSPICAALGMAASLAPVRWRGEAGALAGLGRSRVQIVAGAVGGGALVALAAALLIGLVPRVDVAGFYPTATHASAWHWSGDSSGAAFEDTIHGMRVAADGMPARLLVEPGWSVASLPLHARAAAALTTAIAGLALPLLLAHALLSRSPDRRFDRTDAWIGAAAVVSLAASVVLFQAAAAHQVPAVSATGPAVALLALAVQRYRSAP